jgi:hypothetical protein
LASPLKLYAPEALAVVVAVAAPPRFSVAEAPLAAGVLAPPIENVAGVVITRDVVVVRTSAPLVPVRLSVALPAGVVAAVVTVSVAVPEPFTVVGVNTPVAFAGNPVTLNVTGPAKPFCEVIVMV